MRPSFTLAWPPGSALRWAVGVAFLAACGARSQPLLEDPASEVTATGTGGAPAGTGAGAGASEASSSAGGAPPCDADFDGFERGACGGSDCDDTDPAIHPGAADFNVTQGPWVVTRVMENIPEDPRGKTALAMDGVGAFHITYGGAGLRYATNRGGDWVSEIVDPAGFGPTSLAIDADGVAHVSYAVPAEGLRYAMGGSGMWDLETVDASAIGPSSLVLDLSGRPHLLYDTPTGASLATRSAEGWSTYFTVTGAVGASALAIDDQGRVHGAIALETGLFYFTGPGPDGAWTTQLVDPASLVGAVSIALAHTGAVHVAFSSYATSTLGLRHATNEGGPWTTDFVADAGVVWSASMAVGAAVPTRLQVAYEDSGIRYATGVAGTWSTATVQPSGAGPALVLAPDGSAHMAHSGFNFSVNTFVDYLTDRLVAPDGVDQNCDGVDGLDADEDGHASTETGGGDCDDDSVLIHPGAPDQPGDGVDQDCDGADGAG